MTKTTAIHMNRRSFFATFSTLILSAMSIAAPIASASGKDDVPGSNSSNSGNSGNSSQTARSRVTLAGTVAHGYAEFRADSGRNRTRLNVEVEDANSIAAGTVLSVFVGGASTPVGTIKLDALHSGELELNSQDGDAVPSVKSGDIVTVMNAGVAILTGVF